VSKSIKYAQVLFVALAFAAMVITTYFFVSDIERKHLRKNAEDAISYAELSIKSDLLEPETILSGVSETIRTMILHGSSAADVHEYLQYINDYLSSGNDKLMVGAIGFFGIFDVFDGAFQSGTRSWKQPEGYDPASRPWYKTAIEAAGNVGITDPYVNIYTNEVSITFSRRIFDDKGQPLGIIGLEMLIDRIGGYAVHTRTVEGSYGILLNRNLEVIAHPSPAYVGKHLRLMNDGIAIENELKNGAEISERKVIDYMGKPSIAFIRQFKNGWYMGIIAKKEDYYQSVNNLGIILAIMGITLTVALSIILLNLLAAKRKSDERMQMMFDSMPLCAYIWDKKHNIIDCNQEAVRLFGTQNKKEMIKRFSDFSPEYQPDGSASKEMIQHHLKTTFEEGFNRFEWTHQKANGRPLPCGVTLVRLEHRGEYIVAGYVRDLRELKALLHEMHRAEVAEESNKAKTKFLARVSHEVRTPMNAILGITEIQLQNEALPPDTQEALDKIYNSGYLLLNIINDILDLSKIEAGKLELTPIKYDTASLINDTVHLNVMRFDSKPIEFHLHVDQHIPTMLFGDELRIKQILNNLLSNAFKYTDRGEVSLTVSCEPGKETDRIILVFRVSDTGQGMSEEQVNRLFDEYTRFNLKANRTTEGTGLGMTIAKHLIQMMDGEISVESEPGKGSVFTVRLPQGDAGMGVLGKDVVENLEQFHLGRAGQMKKAPQIVREYMPYGRILIVDDVETNLYVAKGLLAPYGLSIDTSISGFDAIDKIKSGVTFDIVFMDHFMPKMDGIETTKIMRELGYTNPIIALTANALTGQAEVFLENGFDGFISKPIDIRQLNALLNKLVRDKYPHDVIESARRLKNTVNKHATGSAPLPLADAFLAEIFIRDADKAIAVLEEIQKRGLYGEDDMQSYVTTVHAMKSALANTGEAELSAFALKLEDAGRERNMAVIKDQTSLFLNDLQNLTQKIRQNKEAEEIQKDKTGDSQILREKLLAIQAACAGYDKKAAKEALAELRKETWPLTVKELLNTISGHLLHSDFEDTANLVDNYLKTQKS